MATPGEWELQYSMQETATGYDKNVTVLVIYQRNYSRLLFIVAYTYIHRANCEAVFLRNPCCGIKPQEIGIVCYQLPNRLPERLQLYM